MSASVLACGDVSIPLNLAPFLFVRRLACCPWPGSGCSCVCPRIARTLCAPSEAYARAFGDTAQLPLPEDAASVWSTRRLGMNSSKPVTERPSISCLCVALACVAVACGGGDKHGGGGGGNGGGASGLGGSIGSLDAG